MIHHLTNSRLWLLLASHRHSRRNQSRSPRYLSLTIAPLTLLGSFQRTDASRSGNIVSARSGTTERPLSFNLEPRILKRPLSEQYPQLTPHRTIRTYLILIAGKTRSLTVNGTENGILYQCRLLRTGDLRQDRCCLLSEVPWKGLGTGLTSRDPERECIALRRC